MNKSDGRRGRFGKLARRIPQRARGRRPCFEWLEPRLALTSPSVVSVVPAAHDHTVSDTMRVSATFDQTVASSSVSDQTFAVHATQSGRALQPPHAFVPAGSTVTMFLGAEASFFPGEIVQATATGRLRNAASEPASPYVWQFRIATQGGTGFVEDSGQVIGRSLGTAVALGDLDGDLDLDAFVVGRGPNEVWLNDGTGRFVSSGQTLGNQDSGDVALADLDRDGDLDAFVAGRGGNEVWTNDGLGNFRDSGQRLGSAESSGVALADVDRDGDIDAFVANRGSQPADQVWLNAGNGTFSDSGQRLGNSDSQGVSLDDLDGDGDVDAFVVNAGIFGNEPDEVWLNNGQGSFTNSGQALGASTSIAVALADVDGDRDVDAVVAGATSVAWLNNGTGRFTNSGQTLGDAISRDIALRDLDRDGDLDAFVVKSTLLGGAPAEVWRNNGRGTFVNSGQRLGNAFSTALALGDLDGDSDIDAFVGNESPVTADANAVWLNNGLGTFVTSGQAVGFADARAVALGDLDGDGDLDALIGNLGTANHVWLNTDNGEFADTGQNLGRADTRAVALGDLDGDGDLDAMFGNASNQPNQVWLNNGRGRFTDSGQRLGLSNTFDLALGDLDGDGDLDAVEANGGSQPSRIWINDGLGNFRDKGALLGTRDNVGVALGDLDSDGDLDVMFANSSGQGNTVWLNAGNATFTDSGQSLGNGNSLDVALGDIDNDGDLDAFFANGAGQPDRIWRNDRLGRFTDSGQRLGSSNSHAVRLGDLDGDLDLDAFVIGDRPRVWSNVAGRLVEINQTLVGGEGWGLDLGDVDGDGDLDAWVGNRADANQLWRNLDTPPLRPDAFEPNDRFQDAKSLDTSPFSFTEQLERTFEFLTIHAAENTDWYKWTAPENGRLHVDLIFVHAVGDLDLNLYDSRENLLASSKSEDDNEEVAHTVTKGQIYYIEVRGFAGATHSDYDLSIRGSEFPPDRFEGQAGNDSLQTAAVLESGKQTYPDLTIHNADNDDWFRITPQASGTLEVDIHFTHAQGDLELELVAANGTELIAANTPSDNEQVSWPVVAGETYYVHVFGFEGATSPSYDLSIDIGGATTPTVDIVNVSPDPRAGSVQSIRITFSRLVRGFDLRDLELVRQNATSTSLLPGSATLTTSDSITWTLGNLGGLTAPSGVYELTLDAQGSGIQDLQGNALLAGASDRWINGAGDANLDRQFNQLDLVLVLRAMKYLTGQPATWSQGDWNGDGLFNQFDILVTQQTQPPHYLQGPFSSLAAEPAGEPIVDAVALAAAPAPADGLAARAAVAPQFDAPAATEAVFSQIDNEPSITGVDWTLAKKEQELSQPLAF